MILEPDTGGPLNIEQPTKITTKPLSPKDQDDRIRMVFGLTSNDPLPEVDDEKLEPYHEFWRTISFFRFRPRTGPSTVIQYESRSLVLENPTRSQ